MNQRRFTGPNAFEQFTRFLDTLPLNVAAAEAVAGELAADELYDRAVGNFGDNKKLAPLSQATQDERANAGYSPNDPLYRDGGLLLSKVEKVHAPGVGAIGSPEKVQLYSELGYINARTGKPVPPRPVFHNALEESVPEVLAISEAIIAAGVGAGTPDIKRSSLAVRSKSGTFNFNSGKKP